MKKDFKLEQDGILIEAKFFAAGGVAFWTGTVTDGLITEKFASLDHNGAPHPFSYQLILNSRYVDSDAEIWYATCEIEHWEDAPRDEKPPVVERYLYQIEQLLLVLLDSSPDQNDPDYEHAYFARRSEEDAFTLGYLISEYQWRLLHENHAMTGKPVQKGAALGGQMSSKSKARNAIYSETRRRVSAGEKIGLVAADIVSREKLSIDPRSFERAYRRWEKSGMPYGASSGAQESRRTRLHP